MSRRFPKTNTELMSRDVDPLPTHGPAFPFQEAARLSLGDAQLRHNMGKATTTIRAKREKAVAEMPDWEELREAGRGEGDDLAALVGGVGCPLDQAARLQVAEDLGDVAAVDAGVARAWVSQLERQKGNTSLDMLDRLAKALDVPVATLLQEPEPGASPPQPLPNGRKLGDRRSG